MRSLDRTLLAAGLAVLVVVAAASWAARSLLLVRVTRLEESDARQNVERSLTALSDELSDVGDLASEYAAWDATYAYMASRDPQYVRAELPSAVNVSIRVHVVGLLDEQGRLVVGRRLDLKQRVDTALPRSFEEHLQKPQLRVTRGLGSEGILILPEGTLLLALRPILTTGHEGPARGTFLMGRFLDTWQLDKLTRYTRFSLTFARFDGPGLTEDLAWAKAALVHEGQILARARGADVMSGYARVEDLYRRPALLMRVDGYRRIYHEGLAIAAQLTAWLVLSGFGCGAVALALALRRLPARA